MTKNSRAAHVTFFQGTVANDGIITCPACEQGLPRHDVNEAWVHVSMGSGWVAAYRIVPSGMQPTIGEIRLFPAEEGQRAGRWSGDPGSVPAGGPPSSVFRKLATSNAIELFDEIIERWDEQTDGYIKAEVLKRHGLDRSGGRVPARPGREGRDDLYFATWAAAYVERLQAGDRQPIQTLAHRPPVRFRGRSDLSANTVRGIIAEARERKLLARPPAGRAGGELTEKAIAVLAGEPNRASLDA